MAQRSWQTRQRQDPVVHFELFCDAANERWSAFTVDPKLEPNHNARVLRFTRGMLDVHTPAVQPLEEQHYTAFLRLHDLCFPRSYYTGREIIARLNEERHVLVVVQNGDVAGYVYAEAQPAFESGSIEFVGVARHAQGCQLGMDLLSAGLQWLFSFDSIHELSVRTSEIGMATKLHQKLSGQASNWNVRARNLNEVI